MTGEQLVNKFNSLFPVGSKCHWRPIGKDGVEYELMTVDVPARMHGSEPIVWFKERRGMCSIAERFVAYNIIPAADGEDEKPIDMILPCPVCKTLHVDKPEPMCGNPVFDKTCRRKKHHTGHCTTADEKAAWTNPPHKSHLCHSCGTIWRPADVATNGVAEIKTEGKNDTWHPTGADYPTA